MNPEYLRIMLIRTVVRFSVAVILTCAVITAVTGCGAEAGNPLAVEKMGGSPSLPESMMTIIDCRGFLNGLSIVDGRPPALENPYHHPVHYVGTWTPILGSHESKWMMIHSDSPGSTASIVATMSRVVFDFFDYQMYSDPGVVEFSLDGNVIGEYSLARSAQSGQKILEYMITTNKTSIATVTMTLKSGSVVIAGYMLVFN